MNYKETVDYLYSRLPMFSKQGSSAIKKDLANTIILCNSLNNPQERFKSIHIAGTNGKGSVSHMLASVLQVAGYKTGLYTSPHLRDFRERIRINGQMIAEADIIDFVHKQRDLIETISPSFFEVTVAMAFDYFAAQEVDLAVIEVGLGGRLDSTNIINPILSVITNISFDHVSILGNSLKEIATEKAGIIKEGIPVVIGEASDEVVKKVFDDKAQQQHSPLTLASERWLIENNKASKEAELNLKVSKPSNTNLQEEAVIQVTPPLFGGVEFLNISLDLTGTYQLKNLKTVLSAIEQLRLSGFSISNQQIQSGLSQVTKLTGLMGRWQILNHNPLTICDTGHNEDGIQEVIKNIARVSYHTLHMVIGMVKDKDITKVLSLLPKEARYYFCNPAIERAKPAVDLAKEAQAAGLSGEPYSSVHEALLAAKANADINDFIFIGGSTYVVAEII
ncbi:bifunctional folylpolyglutamate synthase/dihydrofolate synthase [Arcticibacter eurypsychrophilus]|uniref:bifunctional folylpolyglutamate synthase/dihydrofolate synthase n=1 Tax=Arcticibacter eurypsychrophilus TaxID=1434752 RepID=UPI00084D6E84|nr:folylpolyglutamate synthase/dihydrofolate synthase family protein [Arcticibacter eurypsychrophilus]